jgi:prohibitin 1
MLDRIHVVVAPYRLPSNLVVNPLVPVALGTAALQASIYDVPGGYRAVMFDRFSGVKNEVS